MGRRQHLMAQTQNFCRTYPLQLHTTLQVLFVGYTGYRLQLDLLYEAEFTNASTSVIAGLRDEF